MGYECPEPESNAPQRGAGNTVNPVLGLDHQNLSFTIMAAFTADTVGQTRRAAMRTFVGVGLGQMPVGPTLAFAGLGCFFLWNSHRSFLQPLPSGTVIKGHRRKSGRAGWAFRAALPTWDRNSRRCRCRIRCSNPHRTGDKAPGSPSNRPGTAGKPGRRFRAGHPGDPLLPGVA